MTKAEEDVAEQISRETLVGRVEPGAKLAQVVVKMKDTVGAVANVNTLMATLKVDTRQSVAYSVPDGGFAIYNAFVVFEDEKVTLEQLIERLKLSSFVLDVYALEGREGAVVDSVSFPINWQGRRVMIFSQRAVSRMFESIRSTFGSGARVILHKQGTEYGREFATRLSKAVGNNYLVRNCEYALNILKATGWGVPEVSRPSKDFRNATIRLLSCFECDGIRERNGNQTMCSFMSGFVSGVFSVIAGRRLLCEETSCSSRGDSCCEFELREETSAPCH